MILSCQGISKSFGEKVILNDASFHIEEREKAALIGNNGAGKTTLLRIIMNEISADSGQVVLMKDKKCLQPSSISSTWKTACVRSKSR